MQPLPNEVPRRLYGPHSIDRLRVREVECQQKVAPAAKADGWLFDETPKPRGGRRDKKVDVSKYGDEEELSTMSAADLIAKMREDGAIK